MTPGLTDSLQKRPAAWYVLSRPRCAMPTRQAMAHAIASRTPLTPPRSRIQPAVDTPPAPKGQMDCTRHYKCRPLPIAQQPRDAQ